MSFTDMLRSDQEVDAIKRLIARAPQPEKDAAMPVRPVYGSFVAACLRTLLRQIPQLRADQQQSNGAWGIHQFRVRLQGDPTVYRVLIAPADAPIFTGAVPADQHFLEPITKES